MRIRPRDVLMLIVIPSAVFLLLIMPIWIITTAAEAEHRLSCQNAVANQQELAALESIGLELGVPIRFEVPEVPESCAELLTD